MQSKKLAAPSAHKLPALQPKMVGAQPHGAKQLNRAPIAPKVFRPQPAPKALQAKLPASHQPANHSGRASVKPTASLSYRPQPVPRVLQTKSAPGKPPLAAQAPRQPVAPPVYRPQTTPKAAQPKMAPAVQQKSKPSVAPPACGPQAILRVLQVKASAKQQASATIQNSHQPIAQPSTRHQPGAKVLQTKKATTQPTASAHASHARPINVSASSQNGDSGMTSAGKPGRLSGAQPQVAGRAADGVVQPTLMGLLGGAALGTAYTLATAGVGWGVLAGLAIGSAVGHTVTDAYNYFTGGGQPLPVAAPAAAPPFNLDADALLELILSNHEDISQAIQTGAAWEIWKQVQLSIKLRQRGLAVVREASYGDGTSLDLLVRDANATTVAIELKVESATNAGRKLATDVRNDLSKINNYGAVAVNEKWVVGIGYSSAARSALSDISNGMGGIVEYGERGGIGVVVVRANQLF